MNNWNFNEVTQADILDFKACKHNQTGKIYGIKDSSTCQSGKEIDTKDINEMVRKANAGDAKAKKDLEAYRKAKAEGKQATAKEKAEKEAKEKAAKDPKKKGKGGKGKKGGGKGKGGKGSKGGGSGGKSGITPKSEAKANAFLKQSQQKRKAAIRQRQDALRSHLSELQKSLRQIKDPEARKNMEQRIAELMTGVSELSKVQNQPQQKPEENKKAWG